MIKVALLIYDCTQFGGAERVALNMANEFTKEFEVHVISCFGINGKPMIDLDEKVNLFTISNELKNLVLSNGWLAKRLRNYLLENKIDVLINITAGINGLSWRATKKLDIKVIYAEHSNLQNKTYGKKHELRQYIGAKYADYVIALTETDKKVFEERYSIAGKCDFIYNWFDGELSNHQYDVDSKKIISVGRLVSVKGYDRLLAAASIVFAKHPDWRWDIYGDGPLKEELNIQIKENNLENNVFLMGNTNKIIDIYREYAFLGMTSYYEGLPMALLEAQSQKLPIVSFNCPTGPSEIIEDGVNGYLVSNGDVETLASKINCLIENDELRKEFSNSSQKGIDRFSKETIFEKWRKVIQLVHGGK